MLVELRLVTCDGTHLSLKAATHLINVKHYVIMNGEIICTDQKRFLYQDVNVCISAVKLGILT